MLQQLSRGIDRATASGCLPPQATMQVHWLQAEGKCWTYSKGNCWPHTEVKGRGLFLFLMGCPLQCQTWVSKLQPEGATAVTSKLLLCGGKRGELQECGEEGQAWASVGGLVCTAL